MEDRRPTDRARATDATATAAAVAPAIVVITRGDPAYSQGRYQVSSCSTRTEG